MSVFCVLALFVLYFLISVMHFLSSYVCGEVTMYAIVVHGMHSACACAAVYLSKLHGAMNLTLKACLFFK